MTTTFDKPLFSLTVGEFLEMQKMGIKSLAEEIPYKETTSKKYAYGIKGIAETFNCSIACANRIKASGKLDKAIKQIGRKIILDIELALELAGQKNGGRASR
jgi:hypothetical protein